MSQAGLERLRELVLDDSSLQAELEVVLEQAPFVQAVMRLAVELELEIEADEVYAAMRAGRRSWLERWC